MPEGAVLQAEEAWSGTRISVTDGILKGSVPGRDAALWHVTSESPANAFPEESDAAGEPSADAPGETPMPSPAHIGQDRGDSREDEAGNPEKTGKGAALLTSAALIAAAAAILCVVLGRRRRR